MSELHGDPKLHALLIGVDHYQPPPASYQGPRYKSLAGCVHDTVRMDSFLRTHMAVPASRIRKLTASDPPTEAPADQPTYDNLISAFRQLTAEAQPGDQVVIHYSGHGGRTPTRFPEHKRFDPFDEGLVPTDISRPDSQYVRDVELAYLVTEMADKGLFVTLFFDCCHAGGALRRWEKNSVSNPLARHNKVEGWKRDRPSMVAPESVLIERWRRLSDSRATIGRRRDRGWVSAAAGHVLLAACRPHEQAYEYSVAPGQQGGAMTHWLIDTLESRGTGITYRQLHDRVYAKVHGLLEFQGPLLEGADDRRVFSTESRQLRHGVKVLRVEDDRLQLNTGQAQGIRRGARFAVFPPGWSNDDLAEERVALVDIEELGGAESWASIVETYRSQIPEPGSLALPLELGPLRKRCTVRLDIGECSESRQALRAVALAIKERNSGFLELVTSDCNAERTVTVETGGAYAILDADGHPLPYLLPALAAADPSSAQQLVDRLEHLARFRNVEELRNHDTSSPLHGRLHIALGRLPDGYDPSDPLEPVADVGCRADVQEGEWLCLTMRNLSEQVLNLTVLDLQTRWNIRQIHPRRGDFLAIDGGREERLALRAGLPTSLSSGRDILKVFATVDSTSFRWLELPVLGDPIRQHKSEEPGNDLEELLLSMAEGQPRFRDMTRATYASREWVTAEVEVRTRR